MTPEQEKIVEKLKAEHGDVAHAMTGGGLVVCKWAPRNQFIEFTKQLKDSKREHLALENLSRMTLVYPSQDEYGKILDRYPGVGMMMGRKVEEMAGLEEVEEIKKEQA